MLIYSYIHSYVHIFILVYIYIYTTSIFKLYTFIPFIINYSIYLCFSLLYIFMLLHICLLQKIQLFLCTSLNILHQKDS